jgi:hypothetical protein
MGHPNLIIRQIWGTRLGSFFRRAEHFAKVRANSAVNPNGTSP